MDIFQDSAQCTERPHPAGDECCVLWVCKETLETPGTEVRDIIEVSTEIGERENIKLLQITPPSIQVQFPDITGGNLMYIEAEKLETGRKDPPWENAILVEGNEIFTLTGLRPDTSYTLRWKAPDRQYADVKVLFLKIKCSIILILF